MGLFPFYLGRSEEGLDNIEQALKVHPDNLTSLWMQSIMLVDVGRLDDAAQVLKRLQASRLENDLLLMTRHALALEAHDAQSATEALSGLQAFVKDPGNSHQHDLTWVTLVTVPFLARHHQVDAALPLLRQLEDRISAPYDWLRENRDLESLRGEPLFQGILSRARTRFQDQVSVLRSAQAVGELPEFLVKPLDDLVARLGISSSK